MKLTTRLRPAAARCLKFERNAESVRTPTYLLLLDSSRRALYVLHLIGRR